MVKLLDMLKDRSIVQTSDLTDFMPWDMEGMCLTLAHDNGDGKPLKVCAWIVIAILLRRMPSDAELEQMDPWERLGPFQPRMLPTNPQTHCMNAGFRSSLPGLGVAQAAFLQHPLNINPPHLRESTKDRKEYAMRQLCEQELREQELREQEEQQLQGMAPKQQHKKQRR